MSEEFIPPGLPINFDFETIKILKKLILQIEP